MTDPAEASQAVVHRDDDHALAGKVRSIVFALAEGVSAAVDVDDDREVRAERGAGGNGDVQEKTVLAASHDHPLVHLVPADGLRAERTKLGAVAHTCPRRMRDADAPTKVLHGGL